MEQRNDIHAGLMRKLVANARAIISDEVGLCIGARKMRNIIEWLKPYEMIRIAEIHVFDKYSERTLLIPTGSARLHCSKDAFELYDAQLEEVNQAFRKKILSVCFEIIEKYDNRVKNNS